MPLFRVTDNSLAQIERTNFETAQFRERQDLQRLLRDQIQAIGHDLYVVSEEFGKWEESNRRIDLLAIDRDANIVVIELKRTEHGGHMELQAIRYSAMVANMTFEQAVRAHNEYASRRGFDWDAEQKLLEFLDLEEINEEEFGQDVKILLVSGDFSRELTTSVLWLNEKGLDIRCIRLRPHTLNGELILQIEQVLPLPEAQEYIIGVREKQRIEAKSRTRDLTKFDLEIAGISFPGLAKRQAIKRVAKRLCEHGASPMELAESSGRPLNSVWRSADGDLTPEELSVALYEQSQNGGLAFDSRRWFMENEFIIHHGGKSWAFTKMWGINTEDIMKKWISMYPDTGIKVSLHNE